jgi:autotransporter-associated beta strand protein
MDGNLYIGGNGAGAGGSGTLQLEDSGSVFAGSTTLYNTGTLALGGSNPRVLGGPFTVLGGTIQAVSDTSFFSGFTLGAGGARVFTNFSDVTFGGVISGAGALDKSGGFTAGPGTLSLTVNNTYTGGTTVSAGRLLANNTSGSATGSGPVTVSPVGETVLGGSGTIAGPVTVTSGAFLLGGRGLVASGALTLANDLTLNPGAKIQLVLGGSGAHSTLIRTAGTWSFPANLAFRFLGSSAQPGFYDNIITGLADDPGNVDTWTIESAGFSGSFSYDGEGNIDLDLTEAPPATSCDWSSAPPYPIPVLANGTATVGSAIYSFSGVSNFALTANAYKFAHRAAPRSARRRGGRVGWHLCLHYGWLRRGSSEQPLSLRSGERYLCRARHFEHRDLGEWRLFPQRQALQDRWPRERQWHSHERGRDL